MLLSEAEDNTVPDAKASPVSDLAQSKTLSTWRCPLCGTQEISPTAGAGKPARLSKANAARGA